MLSAHMQQQQFLTYKCIETEVLKGIKISQKFEEKKLTKTSTNVCSHRTCTIYHTGRHIFSIVKHTQDYFGIFHTFQIGIF